MKTLVSYYRIGVDELVFQFSVEAESVDLARLAVKKYFDGVGGLPDGLHEYYEARGGLPENPKLVRLDSDGVVLGVGFYF